MCAGLEARIEGAYHVVVQQRCYRTAPAPRVRYNEELEEGSAIGDTNDGKREDEEVAGGEGEVKAMSSEQGATGKGGAREISEP